MHSDIRTAVCDCDDPPVQHCHCPCNDCNCKSVSRATAYRHSLPFGQHNTVEEHEDDTIEDPVEEHEDDAVEEHEDNAVDGDTVEELEDNTDDEHDDDTVEEHEDHTVVEHEAEIDQQQPEYYKSLLELLHLKGMHNMSNKCFEDLLRWANNQRSSCACFPHFPESWPAVEGLLTSIGYAPPKVYYICLHEDHPCHYDILENNTAPCKHCGRPGTIKYYFLSLFYKVRAWVRQKSMCEKMMAHWRERRHAPAWLRWSKKFLGLSVQKGNLGWNQVLRTVLLLESR